MFPKTEPGLPDEKNPQVTKIGNFNCSSNDLEQYKCPRCPNFQTFSLTELRNHLRGNCLASNQTYDLYKCTSCHLETYSEYLWIRHNLFDNCGTEEKVKTEVDLKRSLTCEYCLRKYSNETTLLAHKKRSHMIWFHCEHCSFGTKHKPFLVHHLRILHKPEFFQCDLCPYTARAKSSLKNHRILKHGLGKWLQCGHCTYKAVAKWRMLQHLKRHKTVENLQYYVTDKNLTEWLSCEQCNFKTKSETILKKHHMDKHLNLFNCVKSNIDFYECRCENFRTHFLAQMFKHITEGHTSQDLDELEKYSCQDCHFKTYSEYLLVRHNSFKQCVPKKDTISGKDMGCDKIELKCEKCKYVTKKKSHLKSHLKTHEKKLRIHVKITHDGKIQWHKCDQCSFKSKFRGNLTKHLKIHSSNWIKCDLCFFKTKHVHNLNLHKMSKHNIGTKWFNCDICVFQTKREYSLKLHKQTLHGINMESKKPERSDQVLQCKKCPLKCRSKDELTRHVKDHEEKKHQCQYCSHRTKRGYNLKFHIVQKHSDKIQIQWLQCDQCDFKTKMKSILKRHVLERHSEEWVYCAHCSFKTKSKRLLINHLSSLHDIGKKIVFECDTCGFTTKQKTNLKTHQRKHERERIKTERI